MTTECPACGAKLESPEVIHEWTATMYRGAQTRRHRLYSDGSVSQEIMPERWSCPVTTPVGREFAKVLAESG